jgi:hypothetical protein
MAFSCAERAGYDDIDIRHAKRVVSHLAVGCRRRADRSQRYGRADCPIGAAGPGLEGWLTEEFFEPLPEDELAAWQQ